jgi:hypothetical protein
MRKIPVILSLVLLTCLGSSCSDSKASAEEKAEIEKMDSVSKAVEDSTKKLEEQTRKVEETLEKLDKEFETDNQNK